jgi:AcrR family transcriptional regulator
MSRPTSISHEKIIQAAREVFLEKGVQGTTAEVARRAGVAEGTIFYKFKTKFDLFRAAMASHVGDQGPEWLTRLLASVGQGDLKQNLVDAGMGAIEFFRRMLPLIFTSISNMKTAGLPEELLQPEPPPLRVLKRLSSFVEAEMRAGRLRNHDAEVVARMFLGSVMQYVFFEMVMQAQRELPLPADVYVRSLVDILWNGAGPTESGPATGTRKGKRRK